MFISHKVDALNEPIPIYQLNRDVISPVFSYEEPKSRVIIPVGDGLDVDDFILNMLGALIGFAIWKTKFVQRILSEKR